MEGSQCNTVDDVVKYLTSRLEYIHQPIFSKGWQQQFGYRQGYWIQQVWHDSKTGRYAFHSDEYDSWNPDSQTNLGMYPSFTEMLTGVGERYYNLWTMRESKVRKDEE
jgi:hypothetical protein